MKNFTKLLTRGVSSISVEKSLLKKLNSEKPLRIKFGIDPTGSDLTLGHAVVLKKLADFQKLGHKIILLFGTFTAQVGDPSDKSETRKILSPDEVLTNCATYLEQVEKILNIKECEVVHNGDWFEKFSPQDFLHLTAQKSVAQILSRDDFKKRFEAGTDIALIEFLYPLLQGYDSVVLKNDLEIGGNDQLFNLLVGRDLQKKYEVKALQDIMTTKLLVGTDGTEKMSKSLGNYIALMDKPSEIFGKIMSIPDTAMLDYFECLTDLDLQNITKISQEKPRDTKVLLAKTIITWLHDEESANQAEQDFIQKFVKKEIPDDIATIKISATEIGILDLITKECNFANSNGEARRLITGGGVSLNSEKISDPLLQIKIEDGMILKVGKRKFAKLVL